jgi:hypothetical protein
MAGEPSTSHELSERLASSADPAEAHSVHGVLHPGSVYSAAVKRSLARVLGDADPTGSAIAFAARVVERMEPRDPLEEMLVLQALMAHARVLHLTGFANQQDSLPALKAVHEYADRASNTFRRLMLALAEYRKPPRHGGQFTAIRQANIAEQQVVLNGESRDGGNATNEQGCDAHAGHQPGSGAAPPDLSPQPRRAGVAEGVGAASTALGEVHRSPDTRGQGPEQDERVAARGALG